MSAFIKGIEVVLNQLGRPMDTQFDPKLLEPHTDNAERKYVRDLIGSDFFEYLKTQRTANTINYNAAYNPPYPVQVAFADANLEALFLDGKLFNLICVAVVHEALPNVHMQITGTGVQIPQVNFMQAAGASDMRYINDRLKDQIGFLQNEVIKYLCDNSDKYTAFGFDASNKCKCGNTKKYGNSTFPILY